MDNQTFSNNRFDKKDQLLEINPMALRLSGQSSARAFDEHPLRHFPAFTARKACTKRAASCDDLAVCIWNTNLNIRNNPNLSSLHDFIQNRQPKGSKPHKLQTCFFSHMTCAFASSICQEPWWRRTGSNRRPPACKAGALPAELRPRKGMGIWWAWEDLNLRPHAYQARALTN